MDCLDEKTLSSYLDEKISIDERSRIEAHISKCDHCLDLLMVAYEAQKASVECPEFLKQKLKIRFGLKEKRKRTDLKWLIAGIVFFILSFVFKRYFLQFLAVSVILAFKWVMEGEGAKRAIMIFKGIQKDKMQEKKFEWDERKSPPPVSDYRRR